MHWWTVGCRIAKQLQCHSVAENDCAHPCIHALGRSQEIMLIITNKLHLYCAFLIYVNHSNTPLIWGSVSCPRTPWHADWRGRGSNHQPSDWWTSHSTSLYKRTWCKLLWNGIFVPPRMCVSVCVSVCVRDTEDRHVSASSHRGLYSLCHFVQVAFRAEKTDTLSRQNDNR